jgi:multiple sugar transport system substrate-binding protein
VALGTLLVAVIFLGSPAKADAVPEQTPITLRFVSWKPDNPRLWDDAIARFTQAYPHITVVRELAPHSSTAYHDILTQKLKNRDASVDVFFMDVIWVPEFAMAGWAKPLDVEFSAAQREQFLPATIAVGEHGLHQYGVPSRIDAGLLYYRADLLTKYGFAPPATWNELADQADRIIASERGRNPMLRGYSGQFKQYEGLVCNMLEFIEGHEGSLVVDGRHSRLSSSEALAATRFVRERIIGQLASRAALTYQETESLAVFLQGHAVFHRNWPYAWETTNNADRSRVAGLVGIAALPGFVPGRHAATLGGWLYGISAYSQHASEAWQFIEFLSSATLQKRFALAGGIAPSRRALYDDPEILSANPHLTQHMAVLESASPRPRTPAYPAVSHLLQSYFSRALSLERFDLLREAARTDAQIDRLLALTNGQP